MIPSTPSVAGVGTALRNLTDLVYSSAPTNIWWVSVRKYRVSVSLVWRLLKLAEVPTIKFIFEFTFGITLITS
jgi:hypothetical protein